MRSNGGISGARIAELERIGYGIPESGGDFDAIFQSVPKVTSVGMSIEDARAIQADLGGAQSLGRLMWSAGWQFGVCRQLGQFEQCELAKRQAARIARGIESHTVRVGLQADWRSGVTLGIQAVIDELEADGGELGSSLPSMQRGW